MDDAELGDITVKAVELGETISVVVEASATAVASAMAVASMAAVASAAAVASVAAVATLAFASVLASDFTSGVAEGVYDAMHSDKGGNHTSLLMG
jgi:hypothetical protein